VSLALQPHEILYLCQHHSFNPPQPSTGLPLFLFFGHKTVFSSNIPFNLLSLMFRIHLQTSRSARLQSPIAARLFHTTSSANGRPGPIAFDYSQLAEIPETVEGLSKHLHHVYTSAGSLRRAQADNKRVNVVSRKLCGQFNYILLRLSFLMFDR
jgi:hypothetical protein